MEPTTVILGGITVSVISGVIGKFIGDKGKVDNNLCVERRLACSTLLIEKIDHLTELVKNGGRESS